MIAYAFKWNDGKLGIWSLSYFRASTVKNAEDFFETNWKEIKKNGHTIVKVKIEELTTLKG